MTVSRHSAEHCPRGDGSLLRHSPWLLPSAEVHTEVPWSLTIQLLGCVLLCPPRRQLSLPRAFQRRRYCYPKPLPCSGRPAAGRDPDGLQKAAKNGNPTEPSREPVPTQYLGAGQWGPPGESRNRPGPGVQTGVGAASGCTAHAASAAVVCALLCPPRPMHSGLELPISKAGLVYFFYENCVFGIHWTVLCWDKNG